jgi:alpha-beta hydrolase superfamily lysophospholipase
VRDPLCGFGLDQAARARALADPARVAAMRADLPMYVVVGDQDPVGGMLALVQRYAGLSDVTLRIYEGARHEVLNETNRAEVVAGLITWLDQHL